MIRATICLSLSLLFLCVSGTAQYAGAKAVKGPARKGFDSITAKDCRTWLGTLASDAFEGRETGYPGYQKAADFVAGKFKEFGLEPIGENGSYFQMVPFIRSGTSPESSLVAPNLTLKCHEDFTCRAGQDTTISGDVIFIAAQNRDARIPDAEVTQGKIVVLAMAAGGSTFRMRVYGQIRRHAAAILRVQEFKAAKPSISPAWRQSRRRDATRSADPSLRPPRNDWPNPWEWMPGSLTARPPGMMTSSSRSLKTNRSS